MKRDRSSPAGLKSGAGIVGTVMIEDVSARPDEVSGLAPVDDGVFRPPWRSRQAPDTLRPLLAMHRLAHPTSDLRQLKRAFDVAERLHFRQFRKSGEPYITHPVAVATILANLGMESTTLVAALLHDAIESTDYSLEAMQADFGPEVALLVDGVTKLNKVKLGDPSKVETIRKMVIAIAKDPQVLLLKIADRLHNMRTLAVLPGPKQVQKAKETLEIFAPLAQRLGMDVMRSELEDLAFRILHPRRFEELARLVREHQPQRLTLLRQVINRVQLDLREVKIKAQVTGRPKHLYSIYQKMVAQGREFDDIDDLVGVRILVDTVRDCYAALGVIHADWQPVSGRFKDYIAMPDFNMYQSLHTTVIGPTGKPVEMQIRTYAMHRTAEFGMAARWNYTEHKEEKGTQIVGPLAHIDEMTWLRRLLDWQREAADPSEFLDALRFDLSSQEVYVFTPKGDVIPLPTGSTPVDFAYAVHTEVGHKCIGARVNGKLVPLESMLSNGDVIEIFTSKSDTSGPTRDWLSFVRSRRARTRIRRYLNDSRREEAITVGKEAIVQAMRRQGLPWQRLLTDENLDAVALALELPDSALLYMAVADNVVSVESVLQAIVPGVVEATVLDKRAESVVPDRRRRDQGTGPDPGVMVMDVSDVWVRVARCCNPVAGDAVFGYATRSGGVSVHRDECLNAIELREQGERIVEVSWKPAKALTFRMSIQVEALDRRKLLADVTKALIDEGVNILFSTVTITRDRVAVSRFDVEVADPRRPGYLMTVLRKVDGVLDAYRVPSGE